MPHNKAFLPSAFCLVCVAVNLAARPWRFVTRIGVAAAASPSRRTVPDAMRRRRDPSHGVRPPRPAGARRDRRDRRDRRFEPRQGVPRARPVPGLSWGGSAEFGRATSANQTPLSRTPLRDRLRPRFVCPAIMQRREPAGSGQRGERTHPILLLVAAWQHGEMRHLRHSSGYCF